MDADFWLQKWQANEIGFHEGQANALLVRHWEALHVTPGSRLFLPLCGKTRDIAWFLTQGYKVAGAELSELAIRQLFDELGTKPVISKSGRLTRFAAQNIDIFVGDIFDLWSQTLGPIDAVYDRAALVAMPEDMRGRYAAHLMDITARAPQLLVCFEYDQRVQEGPPFSIGKEKVAQYYARDFNLNLAETADVAGGLKGKCPATESVWLLQPR